MVVGDFIAEWVTFPTGVRSSGRTKKYGGGTVLVWDRGHRIPEGDHTAGYTSIMDERYFSVDSFGGLMQIGQPQRGRSSR